MTLEILLVEDNPADVRLVREALAEGGVPARLLALLASLCSCWLTAVLLPSRAR